MYIRVKKIAPYKSIYSYHILLLLLSITFLFPADHGAIPVFILLISLMVISAIVFPRAWQLRSPRALTLKKGWQRRGSKYEQAIFCLLASAILMLLFVFFFEYTSWVSLAWANCLFAVALMYASIYLYMSNSEFYVSKDRGAMSWSLRGLFLIIFYLLLCWAKNSAMGYMDLTNSDVSARIITYAYMVLFVLVLSLPLIGLVYTFVLFFETKIIERARGKGEHKRTQRLYLKYDPMAIALPLMMVATPLILLYGKHHRAVELFFIQKAIEWDSSEGFYCNGYKTLGGKDQARFIRVAEKDYRAFIFTQDDVKSYRLTCQDAYPGYKLEFVLSRSEDIRLQMQVDQFSQGIRRLRRETPRLSR